AATIAKFVTQECSTPFSSSSTSTSSPSSSPSSPSSDLAVAFDSSLCSTEGVETLVVSVFISGLLLTLVGSLRISRRENSSQGLERPGCLGSAFSPPSSWRDGSTSPGSAGVSLSSSRLQYPHTNYR
ncbi:hypothetical protein CSUI_011561, partial [Cystoisospora suis]